MFAFAVWDKHEKKLLIARDRLGIKPLYIYSKNGFLGFASEIKAFHGAGFDMSLSSRGIQTYFTYGHSTSPSTIYTYVKEMRKPEFLPASLTPAWCGKGQDRGSSSRVPDCCAVWGHQDRGRRKGGIRGTPFPRPLSFRALRHSAFPRSIVRRGRSLTNRLIPNFRLPKFRSKPSSQLSPA